MAARILPAIKSGQSVEDRGHERRHQMEVSQIDKEKLAYQREMAKSINAATQRYRRRLGQFVGGGKDDDRPESGLTKTPSPVGRVAPLPQPGKWAKSASYYHKQATQALNAKSTAIATMDPLLKRDFRRRGLVGPTAYISHRQMATDSQQTGMLGALNKLRLRNLTVREAGEGLPRRQYGPYEGFATMSLVHPTTHTVLQNSQKFRKAILAEEAETRRIEGERFVKEKMKEREENEAKEAAEEANKSPSPTRPRRGRSMSLVLASSSPESRRSSQRRNSLQTSFLAKMVEEVEK